MFSVIMFILIIAYIVWMCVAMTKAKGAAQRLEGARAQSLRRGGRFNLEWEGARGRRTRSPARC